MGQVKEILTQTTQTSTLTECPVCHVTPKVHVMQLDGREFRFVGECACQIKRREQEQREFDIHQRRLRVNRLFAIGALGERFRDARFDTCKPFPAEVKGAADACKAFAEFWPRKDGRGILMTGPVGTGKTHLMACVVNAIIPRGYSVVFQSVPDLLGRLRETYGNQESEGDLIRALSEADLLCLDDLGAEKWSERAEEQLYRIINARYLRLRPMVMTSNLPLPAPGVTGKTLLDAIGQRCLDRLFEMCDIYRVDGESVRKKMTRERRGT